MTRLCNLSSRVYQQFMVFLLKGFHENVVNIGYIQVYFGNKVMCIRTPIRGKYQQEKSWNDVYQLCGTRGSLRRVQEDYYNDVYTCNNVRTQIHIPLTGSTLMYSYSPLIHSLKQTITTIDKTEERVN